MEIRILPSNIANMIAAGEVVQRPASVVKELMENAVDAGATKISVIVEDAGRTLVQVIDNGCGMDPDAAVLCFQRHATSKIATAEDLENIRTFGFRGEALPSIASVARVTLRTRPEGMDTGVKVTVTDATANDAPKQDINVCSTPRGCNVEVRDLFYNTPARRKFLKSDSAELKHIISEFTRVALPNTGISFSLVSNGRELMRLGPEPTLKLRIKDIMGETFAQSLLPLQVHTAVCDIEGFVSRPDSLHKSVSNQYFFINGRYFRSPYLNKAVSNAYENISPDGVSPSYVLFIKVDPHIVDVNVHPTKSEIRFEDDGVIFNIVMASVKESLGRSPFRSGTLDFDGGGVPQMHNVGPSFGQFRPDTEPDAAGNPDFNPFENDGYPNQKDWYEGKASVTGEDMSRLFDSVPVREDDGGAWVRGRFIMRPASDGLMVADARRALQRILYEGFMDALMKDKPLSQTTLFPIEVPVGAENIPVLEENRALLSRMGFEIDVFSANSVTVNGVPDSLVDGQKELSALIFEIITALGQERTGIAASMFGPLAERMASSASRSARLPHNSIEAEAVLDRLFACENPDFTPDGHKAVVVLKTDDLEKLFK